jgi:phosphate starvation-inducible PhoH-like protein
MGKSAKFMITGDPGQVDLPRRTIWTKRSFVGFKDIDGIGSFIWMTKILFDID